MDKKMLLVFVSSEFMIKERYRRLFRSMFCGVECPCSLAFGWNENANPSWHFGRFFSVLWSVKNDESSIFYSC
jgi:hypothetical protein